MNVEPTAHQYIQIVAACHRAARATTSGINPHANPREFAQAYRPIKGRGEPVNFRRYPHLADIYEDTCPHQVAMAGAQAGKSLWLMWRLTWYAVKRWGGHVGIYYPDFTIAGKNSARYETFVKSIDQLRKFIGAGDEISSGKDNVMTRSFGPTTLYFQSVAGKSTTESTPMSVVFFDELRSMPHRLVRRAEERLSGQDAENRAIVKASTALLPGSDIHAAFLQGDQRFFHSDCKCADGVALSEVFPECVIDLNGATPELKRKVAHASQQAGLPYCGVRDEIRAQFGDGVLMCPRCGTFIFRPADGWWEPHNPGAFIHSWQFSQMHSPTISAPELAQKVFRPSSGITDLQSMYNDVAGMPYMGSEGRPLDRELLRGLARDDLVWAANQTPEWRRRHMRNCAMGIDQMKGFFLVWIKQWAPNGKARTVHVEVAWGEDPWIRCGVLMGEYDVHTCVVEEGPDSNGALRFADAFPGRVWVVAYAGRGAKMVRWAQRTKAIKGEEIRSSRFSVLVQQDRALQWMCGRLQKRENEWPDPRGLLQRLPRVKDEVRLTPNMDAGPFAPAFVMEDVVFPDLEAVAFAKHYRESANPEDIGARYDLEYAPIGRDPHSALAGMMADIALSRIAPSVLPQEDYAQPWASDSGALNIGGEMYTEEQLQRLVMDMEPE